MAENITPQISPLLEGTITETELGELLPNITGEQLSYLAQNLTHPETIKLLLTFATANNPKAQEILGKLENPEAHSLIADIFIASGNKAVLKLCLRAGYKARNPQQQAVFYALAEQRLLLEKLDPDYNLLAEAFSEADKALQYRIRDALRKLGKDDVFRKLVIFEQAKKQKRVKEGRKHFNLGGKIEQLKVEKQWQELWELVPKVSPDWSMRILRELSLVRWRPAKREDKLLFKNLTALAQTCAGLSPIDFIAKSKVSIKTEVLQIEAYSHNQISYDGKYVASCQHPGTIKVLDIDTQEIIFHYNLAISQNESEVAVFSLNPDNLGILDEFEKYIANAKHNGRVVKWGENWLWFSTLCKIIWLFRKQPKQAGFKVECIRLFQNPSKILGTQNEEWLVIAYETKSECWFEIVNTQTKQIASKSSPFRRWSLNTFNLSNDGKLFAIISDSKLIQLYKLPEFELIKEIEPWQHDVNSPIFSPDGKLLVASNPFLQIWEVESTILSSDFLDSKTRIFPNNIVFQPDGEALVFAPAQRTLALAQKLELLTRTGQIITLLNEATWSWITDITFSPDSRLLRFLNQNGNLITWSSLPIYLYTLPVERGEYSDFMELQQLTARKDLPRDERLWLKFIELCHSLKWRYDIEIDFLPEIIPAHSDIELEEPG